MPSLNQPSARTRIDVADAAEIARTAGERDPNLIDRNDIEDRLGVSPLILDGMRRRPHYFDGRFLTGADLTRDQDYIRQRQADLARASGSGVIAGLEVAGGRDRRGESLIIEPGHGVTPDGQLVIVERRREIPLLDLPSTRRLNATLGLRLEPRAPLGRRTGLFVLALRPVEFTANPIAAYPTSIGGARHVEDGDIIEATAITLIPYSGGGVGSLDEARRLAAREIFLGDPKGLPQDALPLAMLAIDRGALAWVDLGMVRRETGADTPLQVSMGARPRALAEAFVLQHQEHLADVIRDRRAAGLPDAFAAAQSFAALPAAGQLPAASILPDRDGFRQLWFPPSVDVELSFAPADEIAALVEESLALPAIDLNGEPEELDATSVVVIAPVTRPRLQRFAFALERLAIKAQSAPALGLRRAPAIELAAMLTRRHKQFRAPLAGRAGRVDSALTEAEAAELKTWQAAWAEAVSALPASRAEAPMLWYVRRRVVPQHSAAVGVAVPISGGDQRVDVVVRDRTAALGLAPRVKKLAEAGTPAAVAMMTSFLAQPRIAASPVMLAAAVHALEAEAAVADGGARARETAGREFDIRERVGAGGAESFERERRRMSDLIERTDRARRDSLASAIEDVRITADTRPQRLSEADVVGVSNAFAAPDLGDGIVRFEKTRGKELAGEDALWLGDSGLALEVDRLGITLPDGRVAENKFAIFAKSLDQIVKERSADKLATMVKKLQS